MNTSKRLYRSSTDKIIAGILGGVGEYFNIDPTLLRLGYVILSIATGIVPAAIGYAIAYFIVPVKPYIKAEYTEHVDHKEKTEETK